MRTEETQPSPAQPSRAELNVILVVFRKLICDSRSSDSFAERSTVDYIVPGEMELMSAVRSVSCNSSMSKCNKTEVEEEEYGPHSEGPPLIQPAGDCPPPPPPPSGSNLSCSNPDLVQVRVRGRGRQAESNIVNCHVRTQSYGRGTHTRLRLVL